MKLDSAAIPSHILRLMPAEERAALGKAGRTMEEIVAVADAKGERELQQQLLGYLATREIEVLSPAMNRRTTIKVGWPDLTFAYRGVPVVWEVKTPTGRLSPEQESIAPKLRANGWAYAVIRSVPEAKKFLDALDKHS